VVETVREPLIVLDPDLRVRTANDAFYEIFSLQKEETEGRLIYEIADSQWDIPKLKHLLEEILPRNSSLKNYEVKHLHKGAVLKTMLLNARELRQRDGERMILLAIDDITELRQSTSDLRETNEV